MFFTPLSVTAYFIMQETTCSGCEDVTISTISYKNICDGLPWGKTCNTATLRKYKCMYKCMLDNCLLRPKPAG